MGSCDRGNPDRQILLRKAGFESELDWYDGLLPYAMATALKVCIDAVDRDDFVQISFIVLFLKLRHFDPAEQELDEANCPNAELRTAYLRYAKGILWKVAANWIKKERVQRGRSGGSVEDLPTPICEPLSTEPMPVDSIPSVPLDALLQNAGLTPAEQEVARLRLVYELTLPETAIALGRVLGTVSSQWHRGRQKLQRHMGGQS